MSITRKNLSVTFVSTETTKPKAPPKRETIPIKRPTPVPIRRDEPGGKPPVGPCRVK